MQKLQTELTAKINAATAELTQAEDCTRAQRHRVEQRRFDAAEKQ